MESYAANSYAKAVYLNFCEIMEKVKVYSPRRYNSLELLGVRDVRESSHKGLRVRVS